MNIVGVAFCTKDFSKWLQIGWLKSFKLLDMDGHDEKKKGTQRKNNFLQWLEIEL